MTNQQPEKQTKRVSVELEMNQLEAIKSWAKTNKVSSQSAALVELIELGLDGCPELPLEAKGYDLDGYFEYKPASYVGPDNSSIVFERFEANEVECWQARVSNESGLIYVADRGRVIGSEDKLSFGSYK